MQNAHLRMGRLEYRRRIQGRRTPRSPCTWIATLARGADAHLISLFGGDAEVGAITAAIHEKHTFTVTFLDGSQKVVGFGPDAICYRGSINLQGRKQALRHLIAVSTSLHANGSAGRTFILHLGPDTRELAWATLVSFLGLPADPRWSGPILEAMWAEKKIQLLDGIGCTPAAIHGITRRLAGATWAGTISGAAAVSREKWSCALAQVHDRASAEGVFSVNDQ